jgi:hypothetical protein
MNVQENRPNDKATTESHIQYSTGRPSQLIETQALRQATLTETRCPIREPAIEIG